MSFDYIVGAVLGKDGQKIMPAAFPPWITWGVRRGGKLERLKWSRKGPYLCLWCRELCPGRRTSYCSPRCTTFASWTWGWTNLREYIIARDERCKICDSEFPGWKHTPRSTAAAWDTTAAPTCALREHTWEVDHILPVALGGTDDPENLRLACWHCHRGETTKLQQELAKAKRRARRGIPVSQFDLLPARA